MMSASPSDYHCIQIQGVRHNLSHSEVHPDLLDPEDTTEFQGLVGLYTQLLHVLIPVLELPGGG